MKVTTYKLLAAAALVLAAAPAAQAQLSGTVDAGGGLYLQQSFGRALIREPSGEASELELPPGASVQRLVRANDGWIAAGSIDTPEGTDLFLLRGAEGEGVALPTPQNSDGHTLRNNPAPLIERGDLVGMAWVAGPSVIQSAVYASTWSGDDWAPPELVSPVGPGTQIAVTGAVLADGTWLLVWSAYDGNDDEIVWSRRSDAKWSTPVALHEANDNPDVVPAVVALGSGALAAWSSSDGSTYRVRLARLDREVWHEIPFVGPAGSFHPSLIVGEAGPLLLYRTVGPDTWTLRELNERGVPARTAVLNSESTLRPGLAPAGGGALAVFEWPGADLAMPVRVEAEWRAEP